MEKKGQINKKYYKWFSQTNHVRNNSIFIARFDSFVLSFDQKKILPRQQQQIPSTKKCDETGESREKILTSEKNTHTHKVNMDSSEICFRYRVYTKCLSWWIFHKHAQHAADTKMNTFMHSLTHTQKSILMEWKCFSWPIHYTSK